MLILEDKLSSILNIDSMKSENEITWKWVPLQIFGMGIGIWLMRTGASFQPGRCLPGGPCDLTLSILFTGIGFVLFVVSGYSLMKMSFGPLR